MCLLGPPAFLPPPIPPSPLQRLRLNQNLLRQTLRQRKHLHLLQHFLRFPLPTLLASSPSATNSGPNATTPLSNNAVFPSPIAAFTPDSVESMTNLIFMHFSVCPVPQRLYANDFPTSEYFFQSTQLQ
ncbi:hypothetical protein ACTXT7_005262 [Hymenolepis weldensis]